MISIKPAGLKFYSRNWTMWKSCDLCPQRVNNLPGETDLLSNLIQGNDYFMAEIN